MITYLSEDDVAGIDLNMGCPKEFSIQVVSKFNLVILTIYILFFWSQF